MSKFYLKTTTHWSRFSTPNFNNIIKHYIPNNDVVHSTTGRAKNYTLNLYFLLFSNLLDIWHNVGKENIFKLSKTSQKHAILVASPSIATTSTTRGAEYVSACQHCWQALFYFARHFSCVTQNGKKWPKITLNCPKWPNMAQKWPKMAQKWHFWNVAIHAFCQAQIFCCQAPKTILHPWPLTQCPPVEAPVPT